MYYNYAKIFSYNLPIIAIVGARGIGKTYGCKKYVIKKFLQERKKFIWIRDTESALDELRENDGEKFFVDIKKEFKELKGSIKGEVITINGKHAGYLMPMSTYYNYKGNSYEEIKHIVFDEFIAEKSQKKNGSRAVQFANTIETVGRLRTDYRLFLLANALKRGDEVLNLLNIKINEFGFYFNKKKGVVLHYADNNPHFNAKKKESISGKLIMNTPLDNVMSKNKFDDDEKQFYSEMPSKCNLLTILHSDTDSVRIYLKDGVLYIRTDFNEKTNNNIRFVNDLSLVTTKIKLIPKDYLDSIKRAYSHNDCLFESAYAKEIFLQVIKR